MKETKYNFEDLLDIISRLRAPEGCAWDREQTHKSLKTGLIEETYEVLEAIDKESDPMMTEELGDVLLQVVLHAQIAAEENRFDISDITDGICRKMIYRHPHVFGDASAATSSEVLENWELLKKAEKHISCQTDVLRNVPANLPALMRAEKVQKKAAQVGFDWDRIEEVFAKVEEEIAELREAYASGDKDHIIEETGDLLFATVNLSRFVKTNPELALSAATEKFIRRFALMEAVITESGQSMEDLSLADLDAVWNQIKQGKNTGGNYEN